MVTPWLFLHSHLDVDFVLDGALLFRHELAMRDTTGVVRKRGAVGAVRSGAAACVGDPPTGGSRPPPSHRLESGMLDSHS